MANVNGIKVDTRDWQRKMVLAAALHQDVMEKVIRAEHKNGMKTFLRQIPPPSKRVGINAIRNDLGKIVFPVENIEVIRAAEDSYNLPDSYLREFIDPEGVRFKELHQSKLRNKTRGRINHHIRTEHHRGKVKFKNKLMVKENVFNKYVRQRSRKVGSLKKNFTVGLFTLGVKIQSFVLKSQSRAQGLFLDQSHKQNKIITSTGFVPDGLFNEVVRIQRSNAIFRRRILKRSIEKQMELTARKMSSPAFK